MCTHCGPFGYPTQLADGVGALPLVSSRLRNNAFHLVGLGTGRCWWTPRIGPPHAHLASSFESVVWFGAAKVGGVYYDLNDRLIHSDAYDPAATLVRYAVICGLLLSLLIAGQVEVLPNSFVGWLSVIVTSFLWLAFAIRSYAQQVSAFARREKGTLTTARDKRG